MTLSFPLDKAFKISLPDVIGRMLKICLKDRNFVCIMPMTTVQKQSPWYHVDECLQIIQTHTTHTHMHTCTFAANDDIELLFLLYLEELGI